MSTRQQQQTAPPTDPAAQVSHWLSAADDVAVILAEHLKHAFQTAEANGDPQTVELEQLELSFHQVREELERIRRRRDSDSQGARS